MASRMSDGDLQDLSANDADELNAFLAKRKWFESKLKELEEQKNIYPFIQLSDNSTGRTTPPSAGVEDVYELPTKGQLYGWQKERDAIEEEVVAFDGGDLERMKQKTRAVTIVPLTNPSTELVAVTLDLIVVVDRLLTLLRHRSELLDLTLLRHQWDELRIRCFGEIDSLASQIAGIRDATLKWISLGSWEPATPRARRMELLEESETNLEPPQPSDNPLTPTNRPGRTSTAAALSLLESPNVTSPARSALHLSLLRSKVTNVQIRHSTLVSTMIPHAGASLDRMIDITGSLQGLGGVNGPASDGKENEAVPEELLDAQDELEIRSSQLAQDINECRQVMDQCAAAEKNLASLFGCRQAASQLLARITSDTNPDPVSIRTTLDEVSNSLPEPYVWFAPPVGSGLVYSENDVEPRILRLETARREAMTTLERCDQMTSWLERVLAQRDVVRGCIGEYEARSAETLSLFDRITDTTVQFSIDPINDNTQPPLQDIQSLLDRLSAEDVSRPNLSHRATIAKMRYRALLSQTSPDPDVSVAIHSDDLLQTLEDICESSAQLTLQLRTARDRLSQDERIRSLVRDLMGISAKENADLDRVCETLQARIGASLFPGGGSDSLPSHDLDDRIEDVKPDSLQSMRQLCADIERTADANPRYTSATQTCRDIMKTTKAKADRVRKLRILLDKSEAQTAVVNQVRKEAASLLETISLMSDNPTMQSEMENEVVQWLDSLSLRVPYLSTKSDLPTNAAMSRSQQTLNTSAAALPTPPASPTWNDAPTHNLFAVDRLVRDEVNAQAARVSGALAHTISLVSDSTLRPDAGPQGPSHLSDTSLGNTHQEALDGPRRLALTATANQVATETSTKESPPPATDPFAPVVESGPRSRKAAYGALNRSSSSRTSLASSTSSSRTLAPDRPTASRPAGRSQLGQSTGSSSSLRISSTPAVTARSRPSALGDSTSSSRRSSLSWSAASTPAPRRSAPSSSRKSTASISWRSPPNLTTPIRRARKYVPDSTNKLDVAVGEIVNDFKAHVPIVPIGANSTDDYKDMTGSYWIGAEGRAKLCYCRILRSKMVMVRVGGGWVELSKFLADHFSETLLQPGATSPLITHAPLVSDQADTSVTTPVRMRISSAPALASGSPEPTDTVVPQQDDGDLRTPLRFMKKASDSPDARMKEKAALKVGRRSILGKDRE